MSMLELQSSISGMNAAFEAQKSALDVMQKGAAAEGAVEKPALEPHQAQSTVDARAVTGLGSKIDVTV